MTRDEAQVLLPRFLNAITTMAASTESSRKARLAWAVNDVLVFLDSEIPSDLLEHWQEFRKIVVGASVPEYARNHPHFPKSVSVYYLTAKKTQRATELLVLLVEAIVYASCRDAGHHQLK